MSVQVMSWVFKHSTSRNGDRLVLLAIADAAGPDGCGAWPSVPELAGKTGMGERNVLRAVASLQELGELEVEKRLVGSRFRNAYRVVMSPDKLSGRTPVDLSPHTPDKSTPDNLSPDKSSPDNSDTLPLTNATPPPDKSVNAYKEEPPRTVQNHPLDASAPSDAPAPKAKRGTRIPADFQVTSAMVAWARDNAAHVDGRRETQKFINYWTAKAGKDACKIDWVATWRNWMLNAEDRSGGSTSPSFGQDRVRELPTPPADIARDPEAYRAWMRKNAGGAA